MGEDNVVHVDFGGNKGEKLDRDEKIERAAEALANLKYTLELVPEPLQANIDEQLPNLRTTVTNMLNALGEDKSKAEERAEVIYQDLKQLGPEDTSQPPPLKPAS